MRKRTNALRRFQQKLNDEELRENGKKQYIEEEKKYQVTFRKEKINYLEQYCNTTFSYNSWNEANKLA